MAKYCLAYDTIKTLINELGFHTSNSAESDENSKLYYSFEDNDHMVQKSKTLIDLV